MRSLRLVAVLAVIPLVAFHAPSADAPKQRSAREALKPFNELIGAWRAIGTPEGTREEKQKGHWQENLQWTWRFKGDDAWLEVTVDKGKHLAEGTLRYLPTSDQFELTVKTTDKQTLVYTGPLKEHLLTLERVDPTTKETQRYIISLLHNNRYLYQYEVRAEGKALFIKRYMVGCTKEGVPFALSSGEVGPFCVVSGGPPTTKMMYKGKTYYVCCGGCREAFNQQPEKYIKEYEEMLAKLAKERADKNKK